LPPLNSFVPAEALEQTGYFAVIYEPGFNKSDAMYRNALGFLLKKTASLRSFYDMSANIDKENIRVSSRSQRMMQKIAETQKGDIIIIATQLNRCPGLSVREVRKTYANNEFGLGAFQGGAIILANPDWTMIAGRPGINCPGDEMLSVNNQFSDVPRFRSFGEWFAFGPGCFDDVSNLFGSATVFLPE
jgi:hypothetical protein